MEKKILFNGVDEIDTNLVNKGFRLEGGSVYSDLPAEVIYLGRYKDNGVYAIVQKEGLVFVKRTRPDPYCRAYAGDPVRISCMSATSVADFLNKVSGIFFELYQRARYHYPELARVIEKIY